ncbi:MAG: sensor histidine kinase [Bacteroidetes bacterium]|nr:sensor histidine kinase [Bacteroidota bacterium]
MRIIFLILCFLVFGIPAYLQTTKLDSLRVAIDKARDGDEKLSAVIAYCEDYANINQDSLEKFAYVALDLASRSNDKRLKVLSQLTLAQDYMKWGWTDSARYVVEHELKKIPLSDAGFKEIYYRLKNIKALSFAAEGRFEESLKILFELVSESSKYHDSLIMASSSDLIGKIALSRNELGVARKWNDKALSYITPTNSKSLGSILINRGQLYYNEKKLDSALYFLNEGLNFSKKNEQVDLLARGYRYQSVVYTATQQLDEAEMALKNMQEARSKMYSRPDAVIDDNIQIAEFYAQTGQLKKAIDYCWSKLGSGNIYNKQQGDPAQTFNNDPATRLPFYLALARYLKEDKDYPAYQKVLEEIIVLKDTLNQINKAEVIAELQTKYDVKQKENTIISQELKITRKNYLIYGSLALFTLAGIIVWMWLRNIRTKQRIKMQHTIDEARKLSAQSILDAEENERKRIAADLHDNIGAYATAISADVEKIKSKGFANSDNQLQNLQQHSQNIMNSLRDTIWILNREHITITSLSDRIKNYTLKIGQSYDQQIEVEETITNDIRLGSQKALNIFRIVQEAIHNALKHSQAKNIHISIDSNELLKINIRDNGIGMAMRKETAGNGLRNMQARAKDAGIQLSILSSPGKGTLLEMVSTIN